MRPTLLARARTQVMDFALAVRTVSSGPRYPAAMALSIVSWVTQPYCYHATALATGLPISQTGSVACLLAVNLGSSSAPRPRTSDSFSSSYALTASSLGVSREAAVGASLLLQASQAIPVTLLGMPLVPELVFSRGRPKEPIAG